MNDTRHLGRLFEVLKLDENGNPRDPGDPMDVDLREMPVPTLIAFQGRLTAEFARRLSADVVGVDQQRTLANSHGEMQRPNLREHLGQWRPDEGRAEG
jgi:hypothetical protein